jgi:filamentous hemagglutinin
LQSASVGSGSDGTNAFISNMPTGSLIAFNHGDSDSGTTSSAISNGTLNIRDPANQQQDVATLSHDVEHANGAISPIFDKEKEQKRLRQVQLIADIGAQTVDIVHTQGELNAKEAGRKELIDKGIDQPTKEQIAASDAYKKVMADYGVGGDYPRVAQAVTAALQGLVGGDIGSAVAGASAPYLAQVIKKTTGNNDALNTMAHAVLGAVIAQAQGNSALAGGAGAATGELIAHQLYPGTATADLTQEQRETVVALSGLAAGLAGGVAGGDLSGAVTGAQAGTNAVQNNYLSKAQNAQRDKEMGDCPTLVCSTGTATKWTAIDIAQDASFTVGAAAGAVLGLNDTVDSIVHTAGSLKETFAALKAVAESGGVWDAVKQPYIDRIDRLQAQYEEAGASGSYQAGVETGKLISDMAAVLSVGGGVVKGGALLAEKVTAKVAARVELGGAKATPSGLVSGETGFVDAGKAAANDADFAGPKATGEAATQIPGRVQSRVNIANGRTEATPLRDNGNPVSAGFDHVIDGHFNREISNSRSVFTIAPDELKGILQSSSVVKSPVVALPDGQFVRTVDVGRAIGTTTLKDGGVPTSVIKVFTDKAGNLITTFPVKVGN